MSQASFSPLERPIHPKASRGLYQSARQALLRLRQPGGGTPKNQATAQRALDAFAREHSPARVGYRVRAPFAEADFRSGRVESLGGFDTGGSCPGIFLRVSFPEVAEPVRCNLWDCSPDFN